MQKLTTELKKFFSVPKNLVFMVLGPLFFTLFFGYVYSNDYLNDIPIAVYDMDHTALSRSIIDEFGKHERYVVTESVNDMESMEKLIETKQVYMGLVIPSHFQSDMKSKKGTTAALVVDGTNIAIANNAVASASEILNTINAGVNIQFLEGKGVQESTAENYAKLIQFNTNILWDSKLTYKYYVMPGMVLVLVQQLFLSIFVVNYIKDQQNTIIKAGIHALVGTGAYLLCLLVLEHIVGVQIRGSILVAAGMAGFYLLCLMGTAMTIGALTRNDLRATQFCMMMSLPSFLTAGYVWPIFKMPAVLTVIIKGIWPLIYMVSPLRDYLIKGQFPSSFGSNIVQMMIFGVLWLVIGRITSVKRLIPKED